MSPRARLIAALLLLIAVVGVCASYHGHNTLLTAFRAAQAAAAIGLLLTSAAIARNDLVTGHNCCGVPTKMPHILTHAATRLGVVLLC